MRQWLPPPPLDFTVSAWAARAAGLTTPEQWRGWARRPHLPAAEAPDDAQDIAALLRRRLDAAGRLAVQAAMACQSSFDATPTVFASRHGSTTRNVRLLDTLATAEPLSPTDFSLSVHNSVAGLHAMAQGNRAPYTALAAGPHSAEAAVVEATALLADGAPEVLLVVYDAPLPAVYSAYADEPEGLFAWAWRIHRATAGPRLRLSAAQPVSTPQGPLPAALNVLQFMLSGSPRLVVPGARKSWLWQRHA